MKYLKLFEEFDFNQTIGVTSQSSLINYYECKDCNALFKSPNEILNRCKYCNGKNIINTDRDVWYNLVSDRLEEDEREELGIEKQKEEDSLVHWF